MAEPVHPWDKLEREYLNGEYKSLKEMSAKAGISYKFIQKQSVKRGWKKKKDALKDRISRAIEDDIVSEKVSEAAKAREQLLGIANLILNQCVQRFKDPKTGKLQKRAITNVQTAISGFSIAARVKTELLGLKLQSDDAGDTTNIYQNIQNQKNNFEGITDDELEGIVAYGRRRLGIADGRGVSGPVKKKGGKKQSK